MARRSEGRETWHRLLEWDRGQGPAERLAAILLYHDGFQNIDPSHPLGGRDGQKDIVFFEKDSKWIAGVYFPRGQQSFKDIKDKFLDDFKGVAANQASGFAFITNQELRLAERQTLKEVDTSINIVVYHLERIATMLNTPVNYGARLEFLDIEMTKEEQLSFFSKISSVSAAQRKPILSLKGVFEDKPVLDACAYTKNWLDAEFMKAMEQNIREIYEQIKAIALPIKNDNQLIESKEPDTEGSNLSLSQYPGIEKIRAFGEKMNKVDVSGLFNIKDVEISAHERKIITDYFAKKGLSVCNDFFLLGNLKKNTATFALPFSSSGPSLVGTHEEQAKYNALMKLYRRIKEYSDYFDFFSELQEKYYVKCVISNTGASFDEDIDIKLIFPSGCICYPNDLPVPGYSFIEIFNENSLEEKIFKMEPIVDIDEFSNYPVNPSYHIQKSNWPVLMQAESASEEYARHKEIYHSAIGQLFCYTVHPGPKSDIFSFNIPYLKQNTNMSLPTLLVFNSLPNEIEFEMRSKHLSEVIFGTLKIKERS